MKKPALKIPKDKKIPANCRDFHSLRSKRKLLRLILSR
ncbi:hypothetical protein LEP1GSC061_0311 [Leptospira wolffii serovar Khorat str. Khorat-H2]|nr:hypothetical protein LEP1GSC061_0311 [Leptospira wolffii serovar Khorat str. Khorat-H2]